MKYCFKVIIFEYMLRIDPSPPSAAYIRQWTGSHLVQVIGDKPLPEPVLIYCQLDPYEQSYVKF